MHFGNIYKRKKVLVTGDTGFKGSWLVYWLLQLGADVVGISKDIPTQPSHYNMLAAGYPSHRIDIADQEKMQKIFKSEKPEVVFHLAAQSLVRPSYKNPLLTVKDNVLGTASVLSCCVNQQALKAAVIVTSDKCYKSNQSLVSFKESDSLGGHDLYSASKACAEIITEAYRKSFTGRTAETDVLIASARAGNVIGGGDWSEDRLLPDLMKGWHEGNEIEIRYPKAIRPWQHVLEPISGYLELGAGLLRSETDMAESWNFGPEESSKITVEDLIIKTQSLLKELKVKIIDNYHGPEESAYLMLDSTKARSKMNWRAVWTVDQALERTIDWYKNYYTNNSVNTENDLKEFLLAAHPNN